MLGATSFPIEKQKVGEISNKIGSQLSHVITQLESFREEIRQNPRVLNRNMNLGAFQGSVQTGEQSSVAQSSFVASDASTVNISPSVSQPNKSISGDMIDSQFSKTGSVVPAALTSVSSEKEGVYPSNLDTRITRTQLPVQKEELSDIVSKLSYGALLAKEEEIKLRQLNLADLARLVGTGGLQLDLFRVKVGDVIRVVLSFTKRDVFILGKEYINASTNRKTVSATNNFDNLKPLQSKLELYYIVSENKETITSTNFLQTFYRQVFTTHLSKFIPSDVLLETIQYQIVYPQRTKNSLFQLNVQATGAFTGPG